MSTIRSKRIRILGKTMVVLFILSIPVLLLLRRMGFIEIGPPQIIQIKTYNTLTDKEKTHRGEVWFKLAAYTNALEVYTDLLFGTTPSAIKRPEYGTLPIRDKERPKLDLMFYRWCICLSKLNKRTEGMAACDQFQDEFPQSSYLSEIEKLRNELVARQL